MIIGGQPELKGKILGRVSITIICDSYTWVVQKIIAIYTVLFKVLQLTFQKMSPRVVLVCEAVMASLFFNQFVAKYSLILPVVSKKRPLGSDFNLAYKIKSQRPRSGVFGGCQRTTT